MYVHAFKEVLYQMIRSSYLQLLTKLVVCELALFFVF